MSHARYRPGYRDFIQTRAPLRGSLPDFNAPAPPDVWRGVYNLDGDDDRAVWSEGFDSRADAAREGKEYHVVSL